MDKRMVLEVPAAPENMLVVRLTVGGACTRLDFTVDALEDAKIAVAEACLMLMQGRGCAALRVELTPINDGLQARVDALGEGERLQHPGEEYDPDFSKLMLGALTEYLDVQDDTITLHLAGDI